MAIETPLDADLMVDAPIKRIIRTSDRGTFLQCRLKWHFSSKIRLNLEPLRNNFYYDFGTAWHHALRMWYDPVAWGAAKAELRVEAGKLAFKNYLAEQRVTYINRGIDSQEMDEEFDAAIKLGPAMLDNYAKWSLANDDFTPIMVEKEFEVQIGCWFMGGFVALPDGWESCTKEQCTPVVYQGRIDALLEDYLGNYWIGEWKSADKAPGNTRWLQMDPQSGSYIWALRKKLGLNIKGVHRVTTIKRAPQPPRLLKNNQLSVDKTQLTNVELFKESMRQRHELIPITNAEGEKYREYLEFLASENAPQFIYRDVVPRNERQIENIGRWIEADAREMFDDPEIKPTPTMMNCNGCAYYNLSLAWQEGSDWEFLANSEYVVRES
jgi:hypothetical protein